MVFGTVISVTQSLFDALQYSKQLKEMCSFLGYQSELENLKGTIVTVKAVLQDAEAKRELSHEAQCYIEELKDAIYDADDFIDEFVTQAELKQKELAEGWKVSEKVRLFFSRFKVLGVARNLSRGVKEVRERLDAIANNHNRFGFNLDYQPIRKRREETCSYVYAQDIIGREDDMEKIVDMLLDSNVQRDASFLTIVGVGGLGKTTLAQLVYNDERITKHFDLRLWACVSDEDPKHLDVKAVLGKILESATSMKYDGSSLDVLQGKLREKLVGKKYLLVLDDVWNENREEWLKLEKFLIGCHCGSWVVLTTRSKETAKVVRDGYVYELEGLSHEYSWCLFERIAFDKGEGQTNSPDLIKRGKEIVKKCANVPLAIRVVGSLLYGQGRDKWESFQEIGLGEIRKDENIILPILMLSYHNLDSRLKSCFSYCAIFPKDFCMKKEMLISLWMAQGYIVPLNKGQSMEDAADECFSILLQRCFFQDVREDEYTGKISSCKMHDLMHDIAQKVAGKEVCLVNSITSDLDRKTRHISFAQRGKYTEGGPFSSKIGIRTCLLCNWGIKLHVDVLLAKWTCLRTLDLHDSGIKSLPYTIDCSGLIELPNDLSKLLHLWRLHTDGCSRLTYMPPDIGKLSCLQWLTMFVVGKPNSNSKQGIVDQLEDLKALTNLKGRLEIRIRIPKEGAYVKRNDQGGYLRSKKQLNSIEFRWKNKESEGKEEYEEALLEDLRPHPNLRDLELRGYNGKRVPPCWMKGGNFGTFFPNLVRISFRDCQGLQHLPSMEILPHLKVLRVEEMWKLEYLEDTRSNISSYDAGASFFPSLETLCLTKLPKLKGWWRDDGSSSSSSRQPHLLPSFPRLLVLEIQTCPELIRISLCPTMEELELVCFNERLQVIEKTSRELKRGTSACSSSLLLQSLSGSGNSKLREVRTSNVRRLKSTLPIEAFHCLTQMRIWEDAEVESIEEVGEVFQSCSSSLHTLQLFDCKNLSLSNSEREEDEDDDGMPWRSLHQSLRFLELGDLPKVVKLPKGMQYLTSLQTLIIRDFCKGLESLPEWMPRLTSLTRLEVRGCSEELMLRCQSPNGEDWAHIQHIPHLVVSQKLYG